MARTPSPDEARQRAAGGAAVLHEAHAILTRYVVFPSPQAADAAALYAAATHAMPKLEFAARLVIKSPEKRCGKSRLLDVLAQLVARPLTTADISAAALVRSVTAEDPPTVLLDEADAIFGKALKGDEKAEHLRGILNAGFTRDRPYKRWDVAARKVEDCPTFAMAVLAGIGSMPDTIEDRAVIISMRRKALGERVDKYRIRRDKPCVTAVGDRLAAWVASVAEAIGAAVPELPPGLNDRAEDVWEALVSVADEAGGDWPERARSAALVLSGAAELDADASLGIRLLADLRDVFGDLDAMHGEAILTALRKVDGAPWGDYYGRELNSRDLARLLKPYGVRACDVKLGGVTKRGYRRDYLHDAWTRYAPLAPGVSATSATSATSQVSALPAVAGSTSEVLPATSPMPLSRAVAEVAQVAQPPLSGDREQPGACPRHASAGFGPHPDCLDCNPPGRACPECGKSLDGTHSQKQYCGDQCRDKAWRRRRKGSAP